MFALLAICLVVQHIDESLSTNFTLYVLYDFQQKAFPTALIEARGSIALHWKNLRIKVWLSTVVLHFKLKAAVHKLLT